MGADTEEDEQENNGWGGKGGGGGVEIYNIKSSTSSTIASKKRVMGLGKVCRYYLG